MRRTICILIIYAAFGFVSHVIPAGGETVPIPRPKPQRSSSSASMIAPIPRPKPIAAAPEWPHDDGWPATEVAAATATCTQLLKGLDLKWSPRAPIGRQGGCGAPAPIEVSSIDGVDITPPATVTCAMAAALHEWVSGALQPGAQRDLGTRVVAIHNAASYVCRSRNNVSGAKLSEHARANALDMSGFAFAKGAGVEVGAGWGGLLGKIGLSRQGSFLGHARDAACRSFTTVLGPGSDSHHGDHFHVDVLARKNGYRLCH
jgi:hypothetical protein